MLRLLAGVLFAPLVFASGKDTVVFDTDSGMFGDDGAALVMLLRSPMQVSVQAITLVPGNVWPLQGAEYIFHILDLLKRPTMPVYSGAEMPLLNSPENRRSARKLALLEPKLVVFGHGAPLRDTKKFVDFVQALPG